ncbi:glutathione peroxidase [Geminicoccus roseus]|uniref:glutathione peroxidase n=1 Tax=Geminicoccus roseus TaxID=404900 RepID=UPI000406D8CC|nr:glutathione peroxidase [Geminicoccus roseus]
MTGLLDHVARRADGSAYAMSEHAGRIVLVVNTASQCIFAPQFTGLQSLHETYGPRGLSVLAFPCNQFRQQEPRDDGEIQGFCTARYRTTFPVLAKVEVEGAGAHPLFKDLTAALPGLAGPRIRWNFTKFLIDRTGRPVRRFAPFTPPMLLRGAIEKLL